MASYRGSTEITKIYRGSTEITKIYRGSTEVYSSAQDPIQEPTLNYISKTDRTIYFTVTNNNNYELDIYYEHTDSTPDNVSQKVTIGSGQTSGTLYVTQLVPETGYNMYARAYNGDEWSTSDTWWTTTNTGVTIKPNITNYSCYTISSQKYVKWRVQNRDYAGLVTIYTEWNDTTPDEYTFNSIGYLGYTTYVNHMLGAGTTVYAKALYGSYALSAYDSQVISTAFCPVQ